MTLYSGWPYIFLQILTFSKGFILLTVGSIYTKLGDFKKLCLHFMTVWINSCQSHNLQTRTYLVLHGLKSGNAELTQLLESDYSLTRKNLCLIRGHSGNYFNK